MKKILTASFVVVALAGILSITSCSKAVVVLAPISDKSVCFDASAFIGSQDKTYDVLVSDIQAAFSQAGVTYDVARIKSSKFKGFKAVITSGTNFDNIAGFQVYAQSPGAGAPTEADKVAYIDFTGTGVTEVDVTVTGMELKNLLSKDKIILTVRTFNNKNNTPEVCFKLTGGVIEFEAKK